MTSIRGPIPEGGPERQIFLNALREYRNACEAPELTPGCPFFTWSSNGPACGEQCADLLAMYDTDEDEETQIDLGGGIVVVRDKPRRRARHHPSHPLRPFDARQIYLDDDHRPHADRHTIALIVELTELISAPPSQVADRAERTYDIGAAMEQLEVREFDTDAFIRYGIGAILPVHFAVHLLLPMVAERGGAPAITSDVSADQVPPAPEGWSKFFSDCYNADVPEPGDDNATIEYAFHGFLDRIRRWLETALLRDIIEWQAPTELPRDSGEDPAANREARNTAIWLFDRFKTPSVRDWQLSSLHLEWLYLHGRVPAPCSATSMAEHRVSAQDISNEIAQKTSQSWRRGISRERQSDLADSFVTVAANHLRNGRPEIAAAIFEAVLSLSPSDEDARNNYAFCLMPINPLKALSELERLNDSKQPSLTTLANRVLALHLLDRDDEALALAESESARNIPSLSSLMWLVDEDHVLRLSDWLDTRQYLRDLADHVKKDRRSGADALEARDLP
jgi:hypothetical protein